MALQTSGPISLDDLQNEFGGSNPISLSEYYGAASGVPTSGTISLGDFYGTSNLITLSVVSANSANDATALSITGAQAGDLLIAFQGRTEEASAFSAPTPAGHTALYSRQVTSTVIVGKGTETTVSGYIAASYKILTSAETSWAIPDSGSRGLAHVLYRPSSTISSVTKGDFEAFTGDSTVNGSQAGKTFIAVGMVMNRISNSLDNVGFVQLTEDLYAYVTNSYSVGTAGYRFLTAHDDTDPFSDVTFDGQLDENATFWVGVN